MKRSTQKPVSTNGRQLPGLPVAIIAADGSRRIVKLADPREAYLREFNAYCGEGYRAVAVEGGAV